MKKKITDPGKNRGHFSMARLETVIAWGLAGAFLLSLIPMLAIAGYNHPCADDYTYGLLAHRAFTQSGSVFAAIAAAGAKVAERYMKWQGTFSSILLMALQPAVFSERLYVITPFLMLGMLLAGTLAFLKELLMGYLKSSWAQFAIVSAGLLAVSVQTMYSPVEGFYWFNGAVHYVFMYACMLLLAAALLHYLRTKHLQYLIFSCILAVVTGGGNYITALASILLELLMIAFQTVYRRWKGTGQVAVLLCSVVSLGISALAPGNRIRQTNFVKLTIPEAVWASFNAAVRFVLANTSWIYILLLVFLCPFIWRIVKAHRMEIRLPLLVPIASYCFFSAMFAPTEYTMGVAYVNRTANVLLLTLQLLGLLNEICLLCWLARKQEQRKTASGKQPPVSISEGRDVFRCATFCAGVALLMALTVLGTYRHRNYTSVTAVLSWKSGELASYDAQIRDRLELLEDTSKTKLKLDPLTVKPYLLYFDDITENKKDWRNKAMARFYEKEWVVLRKQAEE